MFVCFGGLCGRALVAFMGVWRFGGSLFMGSRGFAGGWTSEVVKWVGWWGKVFLAEFDGGALKLSDGWGGVS